VILGVAILDVIPGEENEFQSAFEQNNLSGLQEKMYD
jgi:hypothetical protein